MENRKPVQFDLKNPEARSKSYNDLSGLLLWTLFDAPHLKKIATDDKEFSMIMGIREAMIFNWRNIIERMMKLNDDNHEGELSEEDSKFFDARFSQFAHCYNKILEFINEKRSNVS